ncbi:hypothetical protein BC833DRAFT_625566 [Globomyces pollinis-pini]|nr:hypothetical protein BC833DRAFT_625566 [Globomyces pollinis-pini]
MSKSPNLLQLSGAMIFNGIGLTLTISTIFQYGISFNLITDVGRQKLLNFISFISIISCIFYYYTNQTKDLSWLNDTCLLLINIGIQYGLVMMGHDCIVKLSVTSTKFPRLFNFILKYIGFLYLLPLFPLSLIVLSIVQSQNQLARLSIYNIKYYKPYSIIVVLFVNFTSILIDVYLYKKIKSITEKRLDTSLKSKKNQVKSISKIDFKKKNGNLSLKTYYTLLIFLVLMDCIGKVMVILDLPAFDSIITIVSIAFRGLITLQFGSKLKDLLFEVHVDSMIESTPPKLPKSNKTAIKSTIAK